MPATGVLAQLVYVSKATNPMREDALMRLARVSARNNAARNITGLLVYRAGVFVQVLEGDPIALADLFYGAILDDRRHTDVERLLFEYADRRAFPDWSMKHFNLDEAVTLTSGDRAALRAFAAMASVVDTTKASGLVLKTFEAAIDDRLRVAA